MDITYWKTSPYISLGGRSEKYFVDNTEKWGIVASRACGYSHFRSCFLRGIMKKMHMGKHTPFLVLAAFVIFFALFSKFAAAAGPELLITWRAKSYVPPDYSGKILPTANSEMTASLEVINQGRVVDISGQTIYWYVNGNLISNGKGVQTVTFHTPNSLPNVATIKAELPFYSGGDLLSEVSIPVVPPEAVIEAAYPNSSFYGGTAEAKAFPYFFNVSTANDLIFSWSVNGQIPTSSENPSILSVNSDPNMPVGSTLLIALDIQNQTNPLEAASKIVSLIFSK